MSYDFSFTRAQMVLLAMLALFMGMLLVVAGYLMGRISILPPEAQVAAPAVPRRTALPVQPSTGEAAVLTAEDAPVLVSSAPATETAGSPAADSVALAPATAAAEPALNAGFALQYGAFRDAANAKDLLKQLADAKISASAVSMRNSLGELFTVVRSGGYATITEARDAASSQANRLGMPIVVRPAGRL